jgi:hypothetical protein
LTAVAPVKLVPLIVTVVPLGPFEGVNVEIVGAAQCENSDVLPLGSVAVVVMASPRGTTCASVVEKLAFPLLLVVAFAAPRKRLPSPKPEGSHVGLAKNSTR